MAVEFSRLNDDVLVYLLGVILEAGTDELESSSRVALVPLSSTCRWLRGLSKPFIFRKIHRTIGITPPTPEFFIPPSLWSYIHHLTVLDWCLHRVTGRDMINDPDDIYLPPPGSPHPYVCQVFIGPVIKHVLQQMPSLAKLSLRTDIGVVHGPVWTFLHLLPTETLEFEDARACAPLTAFRYLTRDRRYALSVEKDALALVLEKVHRTLATLALPSEPSPILLMSRYDWPNLRELKLRGMRWAEPRTPIVLLFAKMPRLRSLALELVVPDDAAPEAIWPPGLPPDTAFPWPELEELTIANPDPDDELFAHLPPCLRTLALPSCPRKCIKEWLWKYEPRRRWFPHTYHVLSASNLLGVLARCSASRLKHLEIEYGADEKECDLLRQLAIEFSDLSSLTLYRYRRSEELVVRVEDVARPLATLALHSICVNLDLETKPARRMRFGSPDSYEPDDLDKFSEILEDVALLLARNLSQSLERLGLWMPTNGSGPMRANFSVLRDGSGKDGDIRILREAFTYRECEEVWGL